MAPAAAVEKPGLLDQVVGSLQSKGALVQRATTAETQVAALTGENTTLKATLATVQAENATFRAERAQMQAALDGAQAETAQAVAVNKDVDLKAAQIVAGIGLNAETLPAADSALPDTEASLNAQLKVAQAAKDDKAIWEISGKLLDLN